MTSIRVQRTTQIASCTGQIRTVQTVSVEYTIGMMRALPIARPRRRRSRSLLKRFFRWILKKVY